MTQQRIFALISKAVKARCSDAQRRTKALGSPTALGLDLLACADATNAYKCHRTVSYAKLQNCAVPCPGLLRQRAEPVIRFIWRIFSGNAPRLKVHSTMDTWRMKHYETLIHACSAWVCKVHKCLSSKDLQPKTLCWISLAAMLVVSQVARCRKILNSQNSHAWLGLVWHAEWSGSPPPCKTAPAIKHLPASSHAIRPHWTYWNGTDCYRQLKWLQFPKCFQRNCKDTRVSCLRFPVS